MKTEYYKRLPGNDRFNYNIVFDLYNEFISQRTDEQISDIITEVAGAEAKVVALKEIQVDYSGMQTRFSQQAKEFDCNSPLTEVLKDKQYQMLIDELRQDGIITLGNLMDINLVYYINSKNIYPWKERLTVWEKLKSLLDPYRMTLENTSKIQVTKGDILDVEQMSDKLHKVDIHNKKSYLHMKPHKFILKGKEFAVTHWIEVVMGVYEELFDCYPSQMAALIDQPVGRGGKPLFGRTRFKFNVKKLNNGLYIDANLSAYGVLNNVQAVCKECRLKPDEFQVFVKSEKTLKSSSKTYQSIESFSTNAKEKDRKTNKQTMMINDVESFIKDWGLIGCSSRDVQRYLNVKHKTIVDVLTEDINIVEISKDKYIHRDDIVDLEEAATIIMSILAVQFQQFYGYSSNRLLYDAARIDLALFLNDNDFDDINKIYYLTKHLFVKEKFSGENYIFYGNMHIWQQEPGYPKSVKGLLVHYARIVQNTISFEECENHLRKLGLSATNLKQQMQITQDPTFLQYDGSKCLLAEALHIDALWISSIAEGLDKLFEDNEYVVSRDIQKEWYETLPALPYGLQWTRLLLQDIIGYYPEVGYRTISALAGQSSDTIHAAIVPKDSFICTFADFVMVFLVHKKMPSQRFSADELRLLLRQHGVIEGNELYWTMHKALNDYRFAWDNENKTVLVNMG